MVISAACRSPFRFGAVLIQLFGLVLSAGITAVIVDVLISSAGRSVRRVAAAAHHVVVCGLGRIGTSVAARCRLGACRWWHRAP
jgi:hypothetical protein